MTRGPLLWAAVAAADRCTVEQREAVAAAVRALSPDIHPRLAAIETCHRVEVYGVAPLEPLLPIGDPATTWTDEDAARHVIRLACGLESAVVGEDQVLHQVRTTLSGLRARHADPVLIRLFELGVGAGRRARNGASLPQRNLGELAVRWLEGRGVVGPARPALVVGTGRMARLAAAAFRRRRASVTIASRTLARAISLATEVDGTALAAADAATDLEPASAVVVATRGTWPLPPEGAARVAALVDLSVPRAIPAEAIDAMGDRFADVDRLWTDASALAGDGAAARAVTIAAYRTRAEAITEEAVAAFRRWSAGRASVATLRALRDRTERQRAAEVERLLRRLPALDERERRLVEAFSERLVANVLHRPSAALRDDLDGSAADAATRLFGL